MLIEIHMIQNHSPSNLNRDDLGAPKTCIFGGVTRARISSQCIKRSIRNPGNAGDVHNRGAGIFAQAMGQHVGVRSKLFPWLVEQELKNSSIPDHEHGRIVLAAQRIATAKEKGKGNKAKDEKADNRPMTPQLISFGRGDAKRFVAKLLELRGGDNGSDEYRYFLDPRVGFEEMVGAQLADLGLDEGEKDHGKIKKVAWVIAKCRMSQIARDDDEELARGEGGQPGQAEAERIAEALVALRGGKIKGCGNREKAV